MSKLQVVGMAIIALVIAPFYWAWRAIRGRKRAARHPASSV